MKTGRVAYRNTHGGLIFNSRSAKAFALFLVRKTIYHFETEDKQSFIVSFVPSFAVACSISNIQRLVSNSVYIATLLRK